MQGVELQRHQEAFEAELRGRPTSASRCGASTVITPERPHDLTGDVELGRDWWGARPRCRSGPDSHGLPPQHPTSHLVVEGLHIFEQVGQHGHALKPRRSDTARAAWYRRRGGSSSHVERSRAGAIGGCPVGTTRRSVRCPVRRLEVEDPPTRNSSPAWAARSRSSSSHSLSTTTARGAGSPTRTPSRRRKPSRRRRPRGSPTGRRARPEPRRREAPGRHSGVRWWAGAVRLRTTTRPRRWYTEVATWRLATGRGRGSHGARRVSNGPTRRSSER